MDYDKLIDKLCGIGFRQEILHSLELLLNKADFVAARKQVETIHDGIEQALGKKFQEGWDLPLNYMTLRDKNSKETGIILELIDSYRRKDALPEHLIIKISDMVEEFADKLTHGLIRQRPLSDDEIKDLIPKLTIEIKPKFNSHYEKLVDLYISTFAQELG